MIIKKNMNKEKHVKYNLNFYNKTNFLIIVLFIDIYL